MKDTIPVIINDDHKFVNDHRIIGRKGEHICTQLEIHLEDSLCDNWVFLNFKKPSGKEVTTTRLDIVDHVAKYDIPNTILDEIGELGVVVSLHNENGMVWKSNTGKFTVVSSIDGGEEISESGDFVTEAQKVMDVIKTDGKGTKYLSDDGAYKFVQGGPGGGTVMDVQVDGESVLDEDGIAHIDLSQIVVDILIEYGLLKLDELTEEQIQALNDMECVIDENGELNITYDESVLNLDFQIENKNLIVNNNINATFSINDNEEMEVSY